MARKADLVVRNGLIVSGEGIHKGDIVVRDGKVSRVYERETGVPAQRVIDASGKYVLPGIIDPHCHPVYADKMDTFSASAAFGGITTVIPFVGNVRAWGFTGRTSEIVKRFIGEGEAASHLDFSLHAAFVGDDDAAGEIPELMRLGVISFKSFMAYPRRGMMMPDAKLLQIMGMAADLGGLPMVHAENGYAVDYLAERFVAQGFTDNRAFLASQPNVLEVEAVTRACTYAAVAGSPIYLVHLSARETMGALLRYKDDGLTVFGETCPQYLTLTNEEVIRHGPLAKVGPPLREEGDTDAMWEALAYGLLDSVGSDSAGLLREQKWVSLAPAPAEGGLPRARNILEARYGASWAEQMLAVVYHEGVNRGRLSLPRLVQVMCENPAKIFGLYPQKGALRPGSDADLVVFDPSIRHTLSAAAQHCKADYTLYEGKEVLGKPVVVVQRGKVVMEEGKLVRPQGRARFIAGRPERAAYAPGGHEVA
ncbi:MAG: amidohydrolase family protein [Chloroflexi bacterium]|nr:amidohydrolase family protein [Chloroflexota bacterium]